MSKATTVPTTQWHELTPEEPITIDAGTVFPCPCGIGDITLTSERSVAKCPICRQTFRMRMTIETDGADTLSQEGSLSDIARLHALFISLYKIEGLVPHALLLSAMARLDLTNSIYADDGRAFPLVLWRDVLPPHLIGEITNPLTRQRVEVTTSPYLPIAAHGMILVARPENSDRLG